MSVELINIDCMDYLAEQPDKSFDLAIVDPPYGIGESGETNKTRGKIAFKKGCKNGYYVPANEYKSFHGDDLLAPEAEYFKELFRVSTNQVVFGANHFIDRMAHPSSCWIVWDKDNGDCDFADCELAWTSFKSAVRKFRFRWAGMLQENMKEKESRIHPTQKPVKLYEWILSKYAEPGQRILDTHLGSGSSAIAAHYFGCDFVGCEIDEHYFKLAQERFDRETRQKALF